MHINPIPRLILRRTPEARAIFGNLPTSTWFEWVSHGLMVPPVAMGARSVAYPDHELEAIVAARISGKSESEIRALVKDLVAARDALADTAAT